jgi:hypothetical protein
LNCSAAGSQGAALVIVFARLSRVSSAIRSRKKATTSSSRNTQPFPIFVPGSSPERAYCAIVSGSALQNAATSWMFIVCVDVFMMFLYLRILWSDFAVSSVPIE